MIEKLLSAAFQTGVFGPDLVTIEKAQLIIELQSPFWGSGLWMFRILR